MSNYSFRLYDTKSKTVKPLETGEPGHLKYYSCGPTVYSYAHIGNFRTFLNADLVVRTAQAIGWKVTYVSNITDVGHLTSDDLGAEGDDGMDRMEKGLKSKEGERFRNVWELADFYANSFIDDWKRLNLREPYVRPRATQYMREQILAAEELVQKGFAYETPDAVYFSIAAFDRYGELSGNKDQDNLKVAVRDVIVDENKRHPADFALWKKDEKHLMQWFSPWGWGFPGWHLECSVMARAYLGDTIDLHAGGEDLIFPHHECEIAQSEALTGKPFSRHWMHSKHLLFDGEKMSKSKGTFFTVRDLVEGKGVEPLALRLALISGVYRQSLNFTLQNLKDASTNYERFKLAYDKAKAAAESGADGADSLTSDLDALYEDALQAMLNDLNTPVAIAKALEGARTILREGDGLTKANGAAGVAFLDKINQLLGIVYSEFGDAGPVKSGAAEDTSWIEEKIAERLEARKAKNFARADEIRKELDEKGIELRDDPTGTTWTKRASI